MFLCFIVPGFVLLCFKECLTFAIYSCTSFWYQSHFLIRHKFWLRHHVCSIWPPGLLNVPLPFRVKRKNGPLLLPASFSCSASLVCFFPGLAVKHPTSWPGLSVQYLGQKKAGTPGESIKTLSSWCFAQHKLIERFFQCQCLAYGPSRIQSMQWILLIWGCIISLIIERSTIMIATSCVPVKLRFPYLGPSPFTGQNSIPVHH